jgi:plastocyanin
VIRPRPGGESLHVRDEHTTRGRTSLQAKGVCLVSLLLLLAVAGCGGDSSKSAAPKGPESATVNIASFKFKPDPIKVRAGGSVTWTNRDSASHTAQTEGAAKGAFHTGTLKKGSTKRIAFRTPGRYKYFCSYHRFMTGTVEVTK